jgi:hypothetical protein
LEFGQKIVWLQHHPVFATIAFYAICFLSLLIIYYGIYVYALRVKIVKKAEAIVLVFIGSLFALLSFGPPIEVYFSRPAPIEPLRLDQLQLLSEFALDPNKKPEDRLSAAKVYYRETCKQIEYFDLNGEKSLYSPDGTDEEYLEARQYLKSKAAGNRLLVISLLVLAASSCFVFLFLLMRKIRKQKP